MVIEVSPVQPEKATAPIEMTELGIITEVSSLLPQAKWFGIDVTESPITSSERGQSVNQPSSLPEGPSQLTALYVTEVRLSHPWNAPMPMLVVELGIVIEVRL